MAKKIGFSEHNGNACVLMLTNKERKWQIDCSLEVK